MRTTLADTSSSRDLCPSRTKHALPGSSRWQLGHSTLLSLFSLPLAPAHVWPSFLLHAAASPSRRRPSSRQEGPLLCRLAWPIGRPLVAAGVSHHSPFHTQFSVFSTSLALVEGEEGGERAERAPVRVRRNDSSKDTRDDRSVLCLLHFAILSPRSHQPGMRVALHALLLLAALACVAASNGKSNGVVSWDWRLSATPCIP